MFLEYVMGEHPLHQASQVARKEFDSFLKQLPRESVEISMVMTPTIEESMGRWENGSNLGPKV